MDLDVEQYSASEKNISIENYVTFSNDDVVDDIKSRLVRVFVGTTLLLGEIPSNITVIVIDGALIVDASHIGYAVTFLTRSSSVVLHENQLEMWAKVTQEGRVHSDKSSYTRVLASKIGLNYGDASHSDIEKQYLDSLSSNTLKVLDVFVKHKALSGKESLTTAYDRENSGAKMSINSALSVVIDGNTPAFTTVSCLGNCIINGVLGVSGGVDCGGRVVVQAVGEIAYITSFGEITCYGNVADQAVITSSLGVRVGGKIGAAAHILTSGSLYITHASGLIMSAQGELPKNISVSKGVKILQSLT